jgi:hypothetical protein
LANEVAGYLSDELGTEIRIKKVDIKFFRSVDLKDFYMEDQRGDTLLYTHRFQMDLRDFSLSREEFDVKRIVLNDPRIKLKIYEGEKDINLQFVLDYFASTEQDTTPSKSHITSDKLVINNAQFSFQDLNSRDSVKGMNFSDLDMYAFHLEASDLDVHADTTQLRIRDLRFQEKSGFDLRNLRTQLRMAPDGIKLDKLYLLTENSELSTEYLEFGISSYADFNNFEEMVRMKARFLEPSAVNMADIGYFVPDLYGFDQIVELHGTVRGTVSNLKTKDLFIRLSEETYFQASLDLNGLPDIENTFIAFSVDELHTSKRDLEKFRMPPFDEEHYLKLPANIGLLGEITFSGSFMGFFNEFVAYGDLQTDLGRVKSDIAFRLDTATQNLTYKGKLSSYNFDVGTFYSTPELGKVTADLAIDTAYGLTFDNLHARLRGDIAYMGLNGYGYQNIALKGVLENDQYDGTLTIHDPNVDLDFAGYINFGKKVPEFNFTANIAGANLFPLNLLDRDPTTSICAKVSVDAVGSNLDDFVGRVVVEDFTYFEAGTDHDFGTLVLETSQSPTGEKGLFLQSDFVVVDAYGRFNFEELGDNFAFMASSIMPSLFPLEGIPNLETEEEFEMSLQLLDPDRITNLLMPELSVSKGAELSLSYSSSADEITVTANAFHIQYNDIKIDRFNLDVEKQADLVFINASTERTELGDSLALDRLRVSLLPYQDNVDAAVKWNNNARNWGDINLSAEVLAADKMNLTIRGSSFSIDSMEWDISERAHVWMDTTSFKIDALTLHSGERSVCLDGMISERTNDQLSISLANIGLDLFNPLMPEGYEFHGMLEGEASVGNVYNELYFSSDLTVKDLAMNDHPLGLLKLENQWDNDRNLIKLMGALTYQNNETMGISGRYYPKREGNELAITCFFQETDLAVLNVFLPQADFSDLKGTATGRLSVNGGIDAPMLQGELDFKGGELTVNYLNTTYTFSGEVGIFPDMFTMDYIPVAYKSSSNNGKKQKGYLSGSLVHENFDNISFDVFMDFEQFLLMNTTYDQNPYFYGKAFGSGSLTFFGYEDNIEITVNVKSEPGTYVYLPLYGSEDVVLQDFVSFVSAADTAQDEDYTVDLTGITMNLEMDVTPDAGVEIQFDPAIGDLMTGRAEGHLSMKIDPLGYFSMLGDLEVREGEYLFTLYNIVNKKFQIKPGGTIKWETGDPYDATVDLSAIYTVKTSLHDLMVEDADQYTDIVPVNCYMNLKNELFNPEISFDIDVQKSDANIEGVINRIKQDETELNRQIFSLMVINKFVPPSSTVGASSAGLAVGGALGTTTLEMLNNQLSNWLSNISEEFDLGFNYQPGDALSNNELALAFETQLLNDKLVLSGNFGVSYGSTNTQNPNQLIGDFSAEYKVDENTRVRMFNQSNTFDATRTVQSPYTQGLGVYYRKEFDKLNEIGWIKKIFGDGSKREKRKQKKAAANAAAALPRQDQDEGSSSVDTISSP